jgi:hypothetical protein
MQTRAPRSRRKSYSGSIVGAGIVAGGPYYCAANNVLYAAICMGQVPLLSPNPSLMANAAREFAGAHLIDPLSNMAERRIYVFSGTDDSIVRQVAVDATMAFFEQVGVMKHNLKYVNKVAAGHAVITPGYGNDCASNAAPYISHCSVGSDGYDQAGVMLEHIYGTLKPLHRHGLQQLGRQQQDPRALSTDQQVGDSAQPARLLGLVGLHQRELRVQIEPANEGDHGDGEQAGAATMTCIRSRLPS